MYIQAMFFNIYGCLKSIAEVKRNQPCDGPLSAPPCHPLPVDSALSEGLE